MLRKARIATHRLFDLVQQQLGEVKVAKVVGANLQLKALDSVSEGAHHDACIEDQQVQTRLCGVDLLGACPHFVQVGEIELLDNNRSLHGHADSHAAGTFEDARRALPKDVLASKEPGAMKAQAGTSAMPVLLGVTFLSWMQSFARCTKALLKSVDTYIVYPVYVLMLADPTSHHVSATLAQLMPAAACAEEL